MRAYADESSGHIGDNFAYVMCAALINEDNMEPCRQVLRRFRKGSAKLHWYEESERRRQLLLEAISTLDIEFAVTHQISSHLKQAGMRRRCLTQLVHILASRGVEHLVLEARNRVDDRRDIANLNWIRQSTDAYIWLQHERGDGEPLLWAADLICGASFARLRGTDSYNEALDRLRIWHS